MRRLAGTSTFAEVVSSNNFPTGAGIASSASAFAALSLAAVAASGLVLSERDLSRLARLGSGSACRSIPGGFVEWQSGESDEDSYAFSIAPADHWALVDCIALVSHKHKPTGSSEGHLLAESSPLQAARLEQAPGHLDNCRRAISGKDFDLLAEVIELDSNLMHAVIMTTSPPVLYWQPATIGVMHAVRARAKGRITRRLHHRRRTQCTRDLPGRGCRPGNCHVERNSWGGTGTPGRPRWTGKAGGRRYRLGRLELC